MPRPANENHKLYSHEFHAEASLLPVRCDPERPLRPAISRTPKLAQYRLVQTFGRPHEQIKVYPRANRRFCCRASLCGTPKISTICLRRSLCVLRAALYEMLFLPNGQGALQQANWDFRPC